MRQKILRGVEDLGEFWFLNFFTLLFEARCRKPPLYLYRGVTTVATLGHPLSAARKEGKGVIRLKHYFRTATTKTNVIKYTYFYRLIKI